MWVNCLTQRPCPWCPWRGFPKSNVQCRMSNEVQWSPMTDKEYQIFISALPTRYWRSGGNALQCTNCTTTTTKISDCYCGGRTFNNVQIAASQHFSAPQVILWFCAGATERNHYLTKAWSKIWSCFQIRKIPGNITSDFSYNIWVELNWIDTKGWFQ